MITTQFLEFQINDESQSTPHRMTSACAIGRDCSIPGYVRTECYRFDAEVVMHERLLKGQTPLSQWTFTELQSKHSFTELEFNPKTDCCHLSFFKFSARDAI